MTCSYKECFNQIVTGLILLGVLPQLNFSWGINKFVSSHKIFGSPRSAVVSTDRKMEIR